MPRGVINTRPERMLISGSGQGRRRQHNSKSQDGTPLKTSKNCIAKRCARRSLALLRRATHTSAVCTAQIPPPAPLHKQGRNP